MTAHTVFGIDWMILAVLVYSCAVIWNTCSELVDYKLSEDLHLRLGSSTQQGITYVNGKVLCGQALLWHDVSKNACRLKGERG